jgi:biotin carboxylase
MCRLDAEDIPTPPTRLVASSTELVLAAYDLGYPDRRLIFKPRRLAGGAGVWSVRSDFELAARGPLTQLPLEAVACALDAVDSGGSTAEYLIQAALSGTDYSVDGLADRGRLLAQVARTRDATLGGLCVEGRVTSTLVPLGELIERVVAALDWSNLINVQLIMTEAGEPFVYEINGRAAGSIGTGSYVGVDLLRAAIEYSRAGVAPQPSLLVPAPPVAFRRYWHDQWWAEPDASG